MPLPAQRPWKAIAAMSRNRVIGRGGRIPWHLPEDFAWFKSCTLGQTVVMGRLTCLSIGRPLPCRDNVVVSRSLDAPPQPGFLLARSLPDAATLAAGLRGHTVWIIGGADLYRQALPACQTLFLTVLNRDLEGDAFFPPFEDCFQLAETVLETADFAILRYENPSPGIVV